MKVVVIFDQDGHFNAFQLGSREEIIECLKTFDGGDYWHNVVSEYYQNFELLSRTMPVKEWHLALERLCQRGTMEIVELK